MRPFNLFLVLAVAIVVGCASVDDDPYKDWPVEKIYNEAHDQMADGSYEEAVKTFDKLLSRYPYGRYAEQAQLEIAFSYYKSEEPALAVAAVDRFLRLYPTHPNADYAYYLKGIINFSGHRDIVSSWFGAQDEDIADRDQKSLRDAYNAFRELIERYPTSRYAEDARQRANFLFHIQARHEVRVAQFYYDRAAYVAVVNRCKYALENYPRTPALEQALALQAKSYKMMGLDALMNDSVRVLRMNFPDSPYLAEINALAPPKGS